MKSNYLISCAVAALMSGSAIGAAQAADQSAAASAGGDATSLETIIVTAQRRDESLQKVPMTLQALSGDQLAQLNVTTFDGLLKYTPNISFGNNGPGQGEIFMRGLSAGFRGNQSSGTIANFPNVAIYLDEQSMSFPARNVDIYMVDMDRIEVLEGPQGTLFGGGAEAGAVRYITKKPNLDSFEAYAEASYGLTDGGAPNDSVNVVVNVPVIADKLALRAVVYNDRHGGYIDNVPSTFTRSNEDLGNFYFNILPNGAGICPNGKPAGAAGFCALATAPQANNLAIAQKDFNPVTYTGGRLSALYQIDEDWNLLVAESLEDLDAQGLSVEYPTGSDFQPLQPLQVTAFQPSFNKDSYSNTAWTLNGKISDFNFIYTGGYNLRHILQQMDYTNYSRSAGGMYYQCSGGSTGWGPAGSTPVCFSPSVFWRDQIRSTHITNEARISTPDDWRFRAIAGVYWEQFDIYDVMNFKYKTIPACTPANLAIALAPGGQPCIADVRTAPGSTANQPGVRDDMTAFGEDTQRGYTQTAIFGSVDYDIIPDTLTLTAGTRWYQYDEFERGSQYGTNTSCLNVPNGTCASGMVNIDAANDKKTYAGFKSRAVVTWHVDDDTMAYFLFSEGFRPGAFNRSVSAVAPGPGGVKQFEKPNGYAPDSLTNYEVGLKTQLLDRRVQLNLSAYWMNWNNVQFLFFNPTELGNTTFGVNGPSYEVKGAEAQVVALVTDGLTVQGSGTYNDDTQSNSPCLVDNIPGTPAFGQCITQVLQKGVGLVPFQNPFGTVGSTPAFSPRWQANFRARYEWSFDDYQAHVQAGLSYMGSMFNQPATYLSGTGVVIPNTTFLRYLQPAYTTFDAAIGIANDKWHAELFAENLGNSHASTFTSSAQFIKSEVPLRPRVIGLKVGVSY